MTLLISGDVDCSLCRHRRRIFWTPPTSS